MSSRFEDTAEEDAVTLISLLHRQLFLSGELPAPSDGPTTTAVTPFKNHAGNGANVPVPPRGTLDRKVEMCPESQQLDTWEAEWICRRLTNLALDNAAVEIAKGRLYAQYAQIKPETSVEEFARKDLEDMVVLVHAATDPGAKTKADTFRIIMVVSVDECGGAEEVDIYHLPKQASWEEVKDALTRGTVDTWARDAGHGPSHSAYGGKWKYQIVTGKVPDAKKYELVTAMDYSVMRLEVVHHSSSILVWNDAMLDDSNVAKARAAGEKSRDERDEEKIMMMQEEEQKDEENEKEHMEGEIEYSEKVQEVEEKNEKE